MFNRFQGPQIELSDECGQIFRTFTPKKLNKGGRNAAEGAQIAEDQRGISLCKLNNPRSRQRSAFSAKQRERRTRTRRAEVGSSLKNFCILFPSKNNVMDLPCLGMGDVGFFLHSRDPLSFRPYFTTFLGGAQEATVGGGRKGGRERERRRNGLRAARSERSKRKEPKFRPRCLLSCTKG